MTTPPRSELADRPDLPVLERVAARLDDLVIQLADLGQDVETISAHLTSRTRTTSPQTIPATIPSTSLESVSAPVPATSPETAPPVPAPAPTPTPDTATAHADTYWTRTLAPLTPPPNPSVAEHLTPPAEHDPRPQTPRPTTPPVWQREGFVSKAVAVAGVGVTLIGVVMTLVLAAQAGYFGPGARVLAGAAFCAALVGLSLRLVDRPGGRVGAIALACTGIAGAYLDVLAASSLYEFVAPAVGLALALGVATGGVALAVRWKVQSLAVAVTLAAAALAPFITGTLDLTLVAYLLVLQVAGAWPEVTRRWGVLALARTAPVVIVASALTISTITSFTLLVVGLVEVVGLSTLLLGTDRHDRNPGLPAGAALLSTVPLSLACATLATPSATVLMLASALALTALLAFDVDAPAERQVALGLALTVNLVVAVSAAHLQVPAIAMALVSIVAALASMRSTSMVPLPVAAFFWVLATLDFAYRTPLPAVVSPGLAGWIGPSAVLSGTLTAVATVLLVRAAARRGLPTRGPAMAIACAVVLYGTSAATVALLNSLAPVLAPLAVTVEWALAAGAALILSVRGRSATTTRAIGLTLTAAVLAKLFLVDLAFLDGMQRSATFLLVGVLLLFTGAKYARLFADSEGSKSHASS